MQADNSWCVIRSDSFMDCTVDSGVISCHPLQDSQEVSWHATGDDEASNGQSESSNEELPVPKPEARSSDEWGDTDETDGTDEGVYESESFLELGEPGTTEARGTEWGHFVVYLSCFHCSRITQHRQESRCLSPNVLSYLEAKKAGN